MNRNPRPPSQFLYHKPTQAPSALVLSQSPPPERAFMPFPTQTRHYHLLRPPHESLLEEKNYVVRLLAETVYFLLQKGIHTCSHLGLL